MKIRIKYSSNQKFIASLEGDCPTLYELKEYIRKFINTNYNVERSNIVLSFNGIDHIRGDQNASLTSLGIVNGDLLIVTDTTEEDQNCLEPEVPATSSHSEKLKHKKMDRIASLMEALEEKPPQTVIDAFNRYDPTNASEVMNILIHLAVTERGFFIDNEQSTGTHNSILPLTWRDMVCILKYHHPGFKNFKSTIAIVTMGGVKQVSASFEGQESEISIRLDTQHFVPSGQMSPNKLTKLSQLAKVVRNKLLHPLQVAAHLTLGVPAPWHIAGLPQEVLIKILSLLTLKSVLALDSTCKSMHSACQDNNLWFILFKKDFKNESHSSDTISGANWQAKYKDLFLRKKDSEASNKRSNLFNPPHLPEPRLPRLPTYPGIDPYHPFEPYRPMPNPYPLQPDYPNPNPFYDPDSAYFGGEIPIVPGPFHPMQPYPMGGGRPRLPRFPPQGRGGPRFDFF